MLKGNKTQCCLREAFQTQTVSRKHEWKAQDTRLSHQNYDADGPDKLILHDVQARYLYISLVESVGQR